MRGAGGEREEKRCDPEPADDPHRPSIGAVQCGHNGARYLHRVTRVFVGLGANLGDRETMLRRALDLLADEPGVELRRVSTFRETEPVGFLDQPPFLNAAAELETELSAPDLLARLLDVERRLGRVRGDARFGPRTIDLDLLLYGGETIRAPGLRVPHPRLHERRFALEPLAELEPELELPGRGPIRLLLPRLD
ncbi:MAG: 2-amino-4-hydroxy-6-hydroxymethyldihydropteridine diphosphokinase [Actinobacteria bacterium]|nr:MAG: 2-amino-4-hydroxy-6-hydroxymethyldihydropteridine diphosphokinase [Actinomycetota bacterium]